MERYPMNGAHGEHTEELGDIKQLHGGGKSFSVE
jgi:hypothetical protein